MTKNLNSSLPFFPLLMKFSILLQYNDKVRVFFYKLVGSHGYSPTAKNWFHFRQWYYTQKLDVNFHPYVDGLVTTEWYKLFETQGRENTMWTQW